MLVSDLPILAQQRIAEVLQQDPSAIVIKCDAPGCSVRKQLGEMCSLALVYRMPGPGTSPYQCPDEQHYGCTHEHALLATLACMVTHIEDGVHTDPKEEKYNHPLLQILEQEIALLAQAS